MACLACVSGNAAGQTATVRTDSILLTQDVDGDGRTDYVVRERRTRSGAVEYRVAVYLGAAPRTHRPNWKSLWEFSDVVDPFVAKSMALAPGVWLLEIYSAGGDGDSDRLLVVHHGRVREEITHSTPYGRGYLEIRREKDGVVVEASLNYLEIRNKPVTMTISCTDSEVGVTRLVFDATKRRFSAAPAFCAPVPQR